MTPTLPTSPDDSQFHPSNQVGAFSPYLKLNKMIITLPLLQDPAMSAFSLPNKKLNFQVVFLITKRYKRKERKKRKKRKGKVGMMKKYHKLYIKNIYVLVTRKKINSLHCYIIDHIRTYMKIIQ